MPEIRSLSGRIIAAKFLQHRPCRLVPVEAELSLELNRREPRGVGCDQVCGGEPEMKRNACDARSYLPSPTLGAGKTSTERVPACSTRTPRREHIGDTGSRPASGTRRGTGDSRLPLRSGFGTQPRCAESRVGP